MSKILTFTELKGEEIRNVSFEAIAAAKKIDQNAEIITTIFSNNERDDVANKMIQFGADRVITITNENLKHYTSDAYTQAMMAVINQEKPTGIIFGHTSTGKDFAPRIANKLDNALVTDVTEIQKNEEDIQFIRPIYSGKAFEKKKIQNGIPFITIRPNNITPNEIDKSRSGNITSLDIDIKDMRTIITDILRKSSDGIDLSEAKIIIAGGRGVKSVDGFKPLYELADTLGAAVGASRGACDAEYCDYSLQIGQTGKIVTPDLYIACGISGAIQHLAGMSHSKVIVAINNDPEAEIFNIADYGIIGDALEIVPILNEKIKEIKASL